VSFDDTQIEKRREGSTVSNESVLLLRLLLLRQLLLRQLLLRQLLLRQLLLRQLLLRQLLLRQLLLCQLLLLLVLFAERNKNRVPLLGDKREAVADNERMRNAWKKREVSRRKKNGQGNADEIAIECHGCTKETALVVDKPCGVLRGTSGTGFCTSGGKRNRHFETVMGDGSCGKHAPEPIGLENKSGGVVWRGHETGGTVWQLAHALRCIFG
jgi:hypothetical protein